MAGNRVLIKAKKEKNDEFYTQLTDVERELKNYKSHFKDKIIFCNCDDPKWSSFWKYFELNFNILGLKKLISSHIVKDSTSYSLEMTKDKNSDTKTIKKDLNGNGDFRSAEVIEILKEVDIVVTNPPFSLFREYVAQLIEYDKKFLIIGHQNNVTYKDIFKLIMNNKIWFGFGFKGGAAHFINKHYENYATSTDKKEGMIRVSGVHWFTNIEHSKRNEDLRLWKSYYENEEDYPKYDNYDCIEVSKVKEIPEDYDSYMGVPITFVDKYNPNQFEILGLDDHRVSLDKTAGANSINSRNIYRRIIIKKK